MTGATPRRAALALITAAACACASAPSNPSARRARLHVPLVEGDALAGVLAYYGRAGRIPVRRVSGPLPPVAARAIEDAGMQARSFQATPDDVRRELELGHPVLAYSGGRLRVIEGFDDARGGFFVDGKGPVPFVAFMRAWEKTGRWALLVLPVEDSRSL